MDELIQSPNYSITPWSMRDVRWLFRRLATRQLNERNYRNRSLHHPIQFFIMGSLALEIWDEHLEPILILLEKSLGLQPTLKSGTLNSPRMLFDQMSEAYENDFQRQLTFAFQMP
jgi:hypothetical protein